MPRLAEVRDDLIAAAAGSAPAVPPVPGGSPFEAIAAVALDLVADAKVARAASEALATAGLLDPAALGGADPLELDDLFRQERVKLAAKSLKPLQRIAGWVARVGLDATTVDNWSTEALREAWTALNGVGSATADRILLVALRRPAFPVDRAAYRIFVRHGWLDPTSDYDEARSALERVAPEDAATLRTLADGLTRVGRDACKPTVAKCDRCPLRSLLPDGGPIEVDP